MGVKRQKKDLNIRKRQMLRFHVFFSCLRLLSTDCGLSLHWLLDIRMASGHKLGISVPARCVRWSITITASITQQSVK